MTKPLNSPTPFQEISKLYANTVRAEGLSVEHAEWLKPRRRKKAVAHAFPKKAVHGWRFSICGLVSIGPGDKRWVAPEGATTCSFCKRRVDKMSPPLDSTSQNS